MVPESAYEKEARGPARAGAGAILDPRVVAAGQAYLLKPRPGVKEELGVGALPFAPSPLVLSTLPFSLQPQTSAEDLETRPVGPLRFQLSGRGLQKLKYNLGLQAS